MATKKAEDKSVRVQHSGGAVVAVSEEKAERLLAGTSWSKPAARTAKSDSKS